ncbi:hypothetical protein HY230_06670 [Candidatus Acetothermia bacterium]|nr:hypothetical protein [Candidatus Acetothermia bacterium]
MARPRTASDKVGIGTTTPAQALEVNGITSLGAPGGVYGYLFAAPSPGPYPTLGFNTYGAPFYLAGVAGYGGILQFQDGDGKFIYYTGSNVAAGAAHVNTPRFAIDKDGNVGIGTTTPTAKLSVQTGTGFYGLVHTDGNIAVGSYVGGSPSGAVGGWLGTKSNHQLHFFTNNGQPSMTIDTNGNVGIGTTTPCASTQLHVVESSSGSDCSSFATAAIFAESDDFHGIIGRTDCCVGVYGDSGGGTGVIGRSKSGLYLFLGLDNGDGNNTRFAVERATGKVLADGAFTGPADFAEMMEVSGTKEQYEPGDVLVIGLDGKLIKASSAYATNLAGVYSTKPGFLGDTEVAAHGIESLEKPSTTQRVPVAVVGIVPVKVSAENGPIKPGDVLTTSSLLGYAMKAEPVMINGLAFYPMGTILGKALESLEKGTGVIQVLVTLR